MMSLLHPEFLLALAVLAIPVIIHLFNFRRFKKVVFPNVRFLREVDLKTRSKNKLRHLLVLLSRLLALTCLVLAFSRPYIPSEGNEKKADRRSIAIYIDNSFSMNLENESGNLLSQATDIAEDIVDAFARNDRFLLLTNDLEAKHQILMSADAFKEELSSITESPSNRTYAEIYERASDALSKTADESKSLFYLSDLQKSSFDPINARIDTSMKTSIVQLSAQGQGNIYIDSIWFESPIRSIHSAEKLVVRVVNASNKELFDIPIRLTIENEQKAIGNMTVRPFNSVDSILTFTNPKNGWLRGNVSINDNPIIFDDQMDFSYEVKKSCNVMLLGNSDDTDVIERIFKNDPFFNVSKSALRQIDMGSIRTQDFIVITEAKTISSGLISELAKFVYEGGSICLIPAMDADLDRINELLLAINANTILQRLENNLKVRSLEVSSPLYQGVFDQIPDNIDLPSVSLYYSFNERTRSSKNELLVLQDGSSLLSSFEHGKGHAYVFGTSTDREASNLTAHSIFITSLLRMAEMSSGNPALYYTIGKDAPISLRLGEKPTDAVYSFQNMNTQMEFIPEQRLIGSETQFFERGQIRDEGIYSINSESDPKALVAFNYNRRESKMQFISKEEAIGELERNGAIDVEFLTADQLSSQSGIASSIAGKQFWRHFIVLALIFLGIEVILLKYWKS
ncbi:MAG: hypothetical protein HKN45_09920 [Flavobacteriales bacterium]|nr:hypothetical protein [Flavobacteriales bacterium]